MGTIPGIPKALRDKDERKARAEEFSELDNAALFARYASVKEELDSFTELHRTAGAGIVQKAELDLELLEEEIENRGLRIPE